MIVIRYSGSGADEPATRVLCPYGTLYGGNGRAWLVGHVEDTPEMRLWRLDRIATMDLVDRCFTRRDDFDLASYAAQSFGVFQEEPIDVVLRFTPEAAEDAACWMFHPSQMLEREDGRALAGAFPGWRRAGNMLASVHLGGRRDRPSTGRAADRSGRHVDERGTAPCHSAIPKPYSTSVTDKY